MRCAGKIDAATIDRRYRPLRLVVLVGQHPPAGIGNRLQRAIEIVRVVELLVYGVVATLVVLKLELFAPHDVVAVHGALIAHRGVRSLGVVCHHPPDGIVHRRTPDRTQVIGITLDRVRGVLMPAPDQAVQRVIAKLVSDGLRRVGLIRGGRSLRSQIAIQIIAVINRSRFGIGRAQEPRQRIIPKAPRTPLPRIRTIALLLYSRQIAQRVIAVQRHRRRRERVNRFRPATERPRGRQTERAVGEVARIIRARAGEPIVRERSRILRRDGEGCIRS